MKRAGLKISLIVILGLLVGHCVSFFLDADEWTQEDFGEAEMRCTEEGCFKEGVFVCEGGGLKFCVDHIAARRCKSCMDWDFRKSQLYKVGGRARRWFARPGVFRVG